MPLDTLDNRAPSLFQRGPSPLARLAMAGAAAVFLMVADSRFHMGDQMRAAIATALLPVQWLGAQPVKAINLLGDYVTTVEEAKHSQEQAAIRVAQQALKAQQVDVLQRENARLRQLLHLNQTLPMQARAAEVVHIAPDPFTRRVVINKGSTHGVVAGAGVIDEAGLMGQVVRVFPLSSEVSVIDNQEQATPVMNLRTGERNLVYGDSQAPKGGSLEVKYAHNTDIQVGDTLLTSGMGGKYPAGLPVGTVALVDKRNNSAFTRVQLVPFARLMALGHVLVLDLPAPVQTDVQALPEPAKPSRPRAALRKGRK